MEITRKRELKKRLRGAPKVNIQLRVIIEKDDWCELPYFVCTMYRERHWFGWGRWHRIETTPFKTYEDAFEDSIKKKAEFVKSHTDDMAMWPYTCSFRKFFKVNEEIDDECKESGWTFVDNCY